MPQPHVLENDNWQVGILPETGGATAFGRIRRGDRWIDFMRPTAPSDYGNVSNCASYPLVPYSNRLRDGRFTFHGQPYQLKVNSSGLAIHGVGRYSPWRVVSADAARIVVSGGSADWPDANFPFRFSTRMEFRLDGPQFIITLWLKNEDSQPMPGGLGHHPYFVQKLDGTDQATVEIPCTQAFALEQDMAVRAPEALPDRLDFRHLRAPLPSINDCLTGREDDRPIRFVYPQSNTEIDLYADSLFGCVVLYAPPEKDFYAVEPVSNANDGFNLYDKGIPGSGVFVLQPGEEKPGTIRFEIK